MHKQITNANNQSSHLGHSMQPVTVPNEWVQPPSTRKILLLKVRHASVPPTTIFGAHPLPRTDSDPTHVEEGPQTNAPKERSTLPFPEDPEQMVLNKQKLRNGSGVKVKRSEVGSFLRNHSPAQFFELNPEALQGLIGEAPISDLRDLFSKGYDGIRVFQSFIAAAKGHDALMDKCLKCVCNLVMLSAMTPEARHILVNGISPKLKNKCKAAVTNPKDFRLKGIYLALTREGYFDNYRPKNFSKEMAQQLLADYDGHLPAETMKALEERANEQR
jgi:hypothetical protein